MNEVQYSHRMDDDGALVYDPGCYLCTALLIPDRDLATLTVEPSWDGGS